MKGTKLTRISIILFRALLLLFLTAGFAAVSRFIFIENMFGQTYFGEPALNAWHMVFFLFIFSSLVIALNSHDQYAMGYFLARVKSGGTISCVKFILTLPEFYLEVICITAVSFLLPTSFLYGFVAKTFFYGLEPEAFPSKLYTLLIILPLMFVLDFAARIVVAKNWCQNKRSERANPASEKKGNIPPTCKRVITVALVYCAASMVIPWFLPFLITVWNIGGGAGFLWILLCIVIAILGVIIACYVRAVLVRRKFIGKLKQYCRANALSLSEIRNPYRSIFVLQDGFDFRIEKSGTKYDCKLIAGVFPGSPMIFSDKGNGLHQNTVRLFRAEVFHFLTKFDYAYASEGRKILIVSPTPRTIYVSVHDSPPRLADTGEKVGEYTIYNSTGFLGALDRNCL